MSTSTVTIRPSREADLEAITAIYGHHVRHGTASFETESPPIEEMRRRRAELLSRGFPYLVAEADGAVLGYAYAGPYRPRAAYRDTVENSVYVHPDTIGHGIGTLLLRALIAECESLGLRQMVAVVGDNGNTASIRLHERCGFRLIGILEAVGYKHGRWLDSVLLQRTLGPGKDTPPRSRIAE
ncbi:MAG: N-acetyltransferase [Alphaproteobacteria bacterium]|nr:N-acetyltransferase [Alphaproteobacteria bacterium]